MREDRARVLVVEDQVDVARMMTLLLRSQDFDVETVHSGQEALATAQLFRPNYVLLDIGLPDISGYQVANQLREVPELDGMVIIAVTAYDPSMYSHLSCQARFDHYLVKPVSFDVLLSLLKEEC